MATDQRSGGTVRHRCDQIRSLEHMPQGGITRHGEGNFAVLSSSRQFHIEVVL